MNLKPYEVPALDVILVGKDVITDSKGTGDTPVDPGFES